MAASEGSVLHQQALTALGFFMGLTLTALVLILTNPSAFQIPFGSLSGEGYFETVVTFVATVGAISSIGLLSFLDVAGGLSLKSGFVDKFGTVLFFLSVFGFMGILPLLLAPFTRVGALVVLVLEVLLVTTYFAGRRASVLSRHTVRSR
ncbi:MAG: hypothetical protein ACREBZ_00175 [Thermoplasmata archaeon]